MKTRKRPARVTLNGAWIRQSAGKALTHFFSPAAAVSNIVTGESVARKSEVKSVAKAARLKSKSKATTAASDAS